MNKPIPSLFFARSDGRVARSAVGIAQVKLLHSLINPLWITLKSRSKDSVEPKRLIYKEFQPFREWQKAKVYIEKLGRSAIVQNHFQLTRLVKSLPYRSSTLT